MLKKIILGVVALLIVAGGALFIINGKDDYDASKYSASIDGGMKVGSKIDFTLPDQFGVSHSLKQSTKTVILSFAKATGHTVKAFLNAQPKEYLPQRDAMFVADISPMPVVIRNTFALPDLKKSSFSVLLIYDKAIADKIRIEDKKDKIVVVKLKNKTITGIDYITTQEELEAALN